MSSDDVGRHRLAARLTRAVEGLTEPQPTPTLVVDLAAFDASSADLARRAAGKPVRGASKSLRIPHLVERALATAGFAGVHSYSLREAGERAEHTLDVHLVRGFEVVGSVPTYRSLGHAW